MKKEMTIHFNHIDDVKDFISIVQCIDEDPALTDGCKFVDAKSILSILSLNLSKDLILQITDWHDEYKLLLNKYSTKKERRKK